ncbi:hypothetical protein GCM10028781_29130 [Nostocoides australiense]
MNGIGVGCWGWIIASVRLRLGSEYAAALGHSGLRDEGRPLSGLAAAAKEEASTHSAHSMPRAPAPREGGSELWSRHTRAPSTYGTGSPIQRITPIARRWR